MPCAFQPLHRCGSGRSRKPVMSKVMVWRRISLRHGARERRIWAALTAGDRDLTALPSTRQCRSRENARHALRPGAVHISTVMSEAISLAGPIDLRPRPRLLTGAPLGIGRQTTPGRKHDPSEEEEMTGMATAPLPPGEPAEPGRERRARRCRAALGRPKKAMMATPPRPLPMIHTPRGPRDAVEHPGVERGEVHREVGLPGARCAPVLRGAWICRGPSTGPSLVAR